MPYTIRPFFEYWAVGKTCEAGVTTDLAYFPDKDEALSMLETLNPDTVLNTYVVHSNVGVAELHLKFDGPSIRITVEHDGDSEVTLTRDGFERMLSMLQSMAELHFNK